MGYKMVETYKKGMTTKMGVVYRLKNGALARRRSATDGRLKITQGATKAHMDKIRSKKRGRKQISPRAAAVAFNRYYNRKSYKSPAARKAAMTRDMCHKRKGDRVVTTNRYSSKKGPATFDFKGVDDGSRCPKGKTVRAYRKPSPARLAGLKKARSVRRSRRTRSPSKKASPAKRKSPAKKSPAKKASPAKKSPAKRKPPAKKSPAKKVVRRSNRVRAQR